jgi:hypothetical protein
MIGRGDGASAVVSGRRRAFAQRRRRRVCADTAIVRTDRATCQRQAVRLAVNESHNATVQTLPVIKDAPFESQRILPHMTAVREARMTTSKDGSNSSNGNNATTRRVRLAQ